jgi:septal ring factor EnvC (AmiA/AmiB activator)
VTVFVNRVEDFRKEADAATQKVKASQKTIGDLTKDLATAQANLKEANDAYNTRVADLQKQVDAAAAQIASKNVDIAKAENDKAVTTAQLTGVTGALKASEEQNKTLQQNLADARQQVDKYIVQARDLNISVSELTAKNDSLEKQRKYLEEQTEQQKKQVSEMNGVMQRAGIKYDAENHEAVAANGQTIVGTPGPIDGIVTATEVIGGVRYATISLGSSDNVAKGMKFYVINRGTGEFLGTLIVDNVQPNEAIGQLDGPKTQMVQKGTEVKTQL